MHPKVAGLRLSEIHVVGSQLLFFVFSSANGPETTKAYSVSLVFQPAGNSITKSHRMYFEATCDLVPCSSTTPKQMTGFNVVADWSI